MTYNVLNYDGGNNRETYFIEIINETEPSIIILQEINGVEGFFRTEIRQPQIKNLYFNKL